MYKRELSQTIFNGYVKTNKLGEFYLESAEDTEVKFCGEKTDLVCDIMEKGVLDSSGQKILAQNGGMKFMETLSNLPGKPYLSVEKMKKE